MQQDDKETLPPGVTSPYQLVDTRKMSKLLGVSMSWLHHDRVNPDKPAQVPFLKLGRSVKYHPATAIKALQSKGGDSNED